MSAELRSEGFEIYVKSDPIAILNELAVQRYWQDERASFSDDIYGQVISANGSLVGSSFAIASASGNQFDPVVAYYSNSQVYLVTWWDGRNSNYDIYGQLISGTGVLSGSNLAISNPAGSGNDQAYPAISVRSPQRIPGNLAE